MMLNIKKKLTRFLRPWNISEGRDERELELKSQRIKGKSRTLDKAEMIVEKVLEICEIGEDGIRKG